MNLASLFAVTASQELISTVARKLLAKYQKKGTQAAGLGDLIPSEDELAKGIFRLLQEKLVDFGDRTESADFDPSLLSLIENAVKNLQTESGNKLLSDGIFGRRTLRWVLNRSACGGQILRPTDPGPPIERNSKGRSVIRFFIEKEGSLLKLPKLGSNATDTLALNHLFIAMENWFAFLNLEVSREHDDPANANLIITTEVLEGVPQNYLAIADIGPPNSRQLRLTFDKAETWDPDMFEATASHEFGHVLGIRHADVPQPGQLMNPTLADGIKRPQLQDLIVAERIWGRR